MTPFGEILRRAVEATPGAVGGAFADSDGEMVDSYVPRADRAYSRHDWAVLAAHYGIVMSQIQAAFGLWHHGDPEYFIATHASLGVVVHAVGGSYYALLAVSDPQRVQFALHALRKATTELAREMA